MPTPRDPRLEAFHGTAARMVSADQQARYRSFIPKVDGMIVVTLPGETMRCPVRKVVNDDTVIIEIESPPISRTHTFRFRDLYGARRRQQPDGREFWELQYEQDFLREQRRLAEAARANKPPPRQAPPPTLKEAAKPAPKKQVAAQKKAAPKKRAAPKKAAKRKRKAA